jgi:hypothetical protein
MSKIYAQKTEHGHEDPYANTRGSFDQEGIEFFELPVGVASLGKGQGKDLGLWVG